MDYSSTPSSLGESFPPSPIFGIDDDGY